MSHRTRTIFFASVLCCAASVRAGSQTIGQLFPIVEPDTKQEILEKASKIDWLKWASRDPARYAAFQSASLPRAQTARSFLFDPTFRLPQALLDKDGNVVYPAGYAVNPLERIRLPGRYIVIGPGDDDYRWLMTFAKPTAGDKVLLANGNVYEQRVLRHAPFMLLDQRFVERFGVRSVPSIIEQQGPKLKVTEYLVEGKQP